MLVWSMLFSACDKTKELQRVENLVDQLRIHNRDIARVTNDAHAAGKISDGFHQNVLVACDVFSRTLDTGDKAVAAAKAVTSKGELKTALDYAERIVDVEIFPAFLNIIDSVVNVPPEIKDKIEAALAAIRGIFSTLRILFADAELAIGGRERYA